MRLLMRSVPLVALALAACGSSKEGPPPDSCSNVPAANVYPAFVADPHYCMFTFAHDVIGARGLAFAPNGDLFVGGNGQVVALWDANDDGIADATERSVFATFPYGNHGVAITATHLYASSPTTVYRWPYATGDRVATGPMEPVVNGLLGAGHLTRTLVIDDKNRLYVSIGSLTNVDPPLTPTTGSLSRALIFRYDLDKIPAGGYLATDGEVFATGLRNEVGLSFDSRGRLWGVENGRDQLLVRGVGEVHYDNPAEEVNLFDVNRPGRNYGYPFCWSEGIWMDAMAKGPGTQHIDPDQPGGFTEATCQDANMIVPPVFALPAHIAPLDIIEYTGHAYPSEMRGSMFITSHGSWNREIAQVGRMIVRLKMDGSGKPIAAENFMGQADGTTGALVQGGWGARPVSIRIDKAGLLTWSDDTANTVDKIGYKP